MNNLDPDVAERPDDLIVYGGIGQGGAQLAGVRRDRARRCAALEHDETLLVQSGKPVGVFQHPSRRAARAHRQRAARAGVGDVGQLPRSRGRGLTMYGQMTAGSWIYIGSQGIVQGTYETLADVGAPPFRRHALAAASSSPPASAAWAARSRSPPTMNGAVALVVEVDPQRIAAAAGDALSRRSDRQPRRGARRASTRWTRDGVARSIGARGQRRRRAAGARRARRHARRPHRSDLRARRAQRLRAQRHVARRSGRAARRAIRDEYIARSMAAMAEHVRAMLALQAARRGRRSTTATTSARRRSRPASPTRSTFPASCPSTSGRSSAKARGRSAGRRSPAIPQDIARHRRRGARDVRRTTRRWCRWIQLARERVAFQGLPARIFWLGYGERARFGLRINELVRDGAIKAPIVIGRDHLDTGSVASPNRETEGMRDGSDAIADWPVLNALLNTSSRRDLGVGAPRRRRRHRLLAARRHGDRRRRHARGRRKARARADLRSGHRRRRATPTPAIPRRSPRAERDRRATSRCARNGAMMTPARHAGAPRRSRRSTRRRRGFPCCSAAAAAAARPLLQQLRDRVGRDRGAVHRRRADRDDAGALPAGGRRRVAVSRVSDCRRGASRRPRRVRRDARLPRRRRAHRRRRAGHVPARRVPRAAHVRELSRACAACCTTSSTASPRAATASS